MMKCLRSMEEDDEEDEKEEDEEWVHGGYVCLSIHSWIEWR